RPDEEDEEEREHSRAARDEPAPADDRGSLRGERPPASARPEGEALTGRASRGRGPALARACGGLALGDLRAVAVLVQRVEGVEERERPDAGGLGVLEVRAGGGRLRAG